jgi:hypothetical protein
LAAEHAGPADLTEKKPHWASQHPSHANFMFTCRRRTTPAFRRTDTDFKTSGEPPHPDTGTERIIPRYRGEAEENLNPYSLTCGLWIPRTLLVARARNDGQNGFARTGISALTQSRASVAMNDYEWLRSSALQGKLPE